MCNDIHHLYKSNEAVTQKNGQCHLLAVGHRTKYDQTALKYKISLTSCCCTTRCMRLTFRRSTYPSQAVDDRTRWWGCTLQKCEMPPTSCFHMTGCDHVIQKHVQCNPPSVTHRMRDCLSESVVWHVTYKLLVIGWEVRWCCISEICVMSLTIW